jgi:hypothetical protein
MSSVTLGAYTDKSAPKPLPLGGSTDGTVGLAPVGSHLEGTAGTTWNSWAYFPNTKQLRNEYVSDSKLGYPMCVTAKGAQSE